MTVKGLCVCWLHMHAHSHSYIMKILRTKFSHIPENKASVQSLKVSIIERSFIHTVFALVPSLRYLTSLILDSIPCLPKEVLRWYHFRGIQNKLLWVYCNCKVKIYTSLSQPKIILYLSKTTHMYTSWAIHRYTRHRDIYKRTKVVLHGII